VWCDCSGAGSWIPGYGTWSFATSGRMARAATWSCLCLRAEGFRYSARTVNRGDSVKSKKGGKSLSADMAWAKRELLAGRRCWCVRTRRGGLVVEFLSTPQEIETPGKSGALEEFTLTPVTLVGGEPRFGIEQPWSNQEGH